MLPDALVLESSNLSNKESVDLYVEENDPELELRLVSSTRSSTHSPRSHDMSSPFITNPQSPQQEGPSHSGVSREDKNTSRKTVDVFSSPRQTTKRHQDFGNELGKHSPIRNESFVDNSLDYPNQTPIKLQNQNVSPWRQFRPPSSLIALQGSSSIFDNKPNLKYTSTTVPQSTDTETNTHSETEDLNKQLVHYRLKLKVMKEFLQDLIKEKRIDPNEIGPIMADVDVYSNQLLLEKQIHQLQVDRNESLEIMDGLRANLEEFERCSKDQDVKIADLNNIIEKCRELISEFAAHLQNDEKTEVWRSVLHQLAAMPLSVQVEGLIQIASGLIQLSVNGRIHTSNTQSPPSTPPLSTCQLDGNIDLAKQIEKLECEKDKLLQLNAQLETDLNEKTQEAQKLRTELETTVESNMLLKEKMELEGKENAEQVTHLKAVIEKFEHDLKNQDYNYAAIDGKDRVIPSSQYESLVIEHQDLQKAYDSLLNELNDFRESAARQSRLDVMEKEKQNSSNLETTYLSEQNNKVAELRGELDLALKKQQLHESELAQKTYINSQLHKENEQLQIKLKKMTDFVTYTTTDEKERVMKKLSVMEFQFKDLLKFDLSEFQKLIQSLNKVAEDESLLNPVKKYERIKKALVGDIDESSIRIMRENHKSVFEYFVRATDILINNYVRLLLAENCEQSTEKLEKQMTKLKEQNSLLKNELEKLYKQVQESAITEMESATSRLRLDDMRQKWKAERERRLMEDREAQKRYSELRSEIARLQSGS